MAEEQIQTAIVLVNPTTTTEEDKNTLDIKNPLVKLQEEYEKFPKFDFMELSEIAQTYGTKDITSKEEYDIVKAQKGKVVKVRTGIEGKRKIINEPINNAKKAIDEHAKNLTATVVKCETMLEEKLKKWEYAVEAAEKKRIDDGKKEVDNYFAEIFTDIETCNTLDDISFVREKYKTEFTTVFGNPLEENEAIHAHFKSVTDSIEDKFTVKQGAIATASLEAEKEKTRAAEAKAKELQDKLDAMEKANTEKKVEGAIVEVAGEVALDQLKKATGISTMTVSKSGSIDLRDEVPAQKANASPAKTVNPLNPVKLEDSRFTEEERIENEVYSELFMLRHYERIAQYKENLNKLPKAKIYSYLYWVVLSYPDIDNVTLSELLRYLD